MKPVSWNEQRSRERVENNDFHDFEVNVADLKRTMDFNNLGKKDVRRAHAAHIYADIPNFHEAVAAAGNDQQKQKKIIRAASVLRRIESELEAEFEVGHLQFQAARAHGIVYTPYDQEVARVDRAVRFAISVNTYIYDVFNSVFDDLLDFASSCGIASGQCLLANVGHHGSRELIALGTCANIAAKILSDGDTIAISSDVYSLLEDDLRVHFKKDRVVAGVQTYEARGLRWTANPDLAEALAVNFNVDRWHDRTVRFRDALPLSEICLSEALVRIDLDELTERNSKRTSTVAIYADLDGFTKLVQEAENDDTVVSLVRKLNMVRAEFHAVAKSDYPGVVLQHQGDRMFAIMHLPAGDALAKRCASGLDLAIGIQSSLAHVLKNKLGDAKELKVAIGLDVAPALITRLGKKGSREPVCLGRAVSTAEDLQVASAGRQITISQEVRDEIEDEEVLNQFRKQSDGSYLAVGLTFPVLDQAKESKAAAGDSLDARGAGPLIQAKREAEQMPRRPTANRRPWSRE